MIKEEIAKQLKNEISGHIKDEISASVSKGIEENLTPMIEHFKSVVKVTVTVMGLMVVGLLFLFLSFINFLPRVLKMSEGMAYLAVGGLFIVIAIIYLKVAKT
jgi:hypothetical protein